MLTLRGLQPLEKSLISALSKKANALLRPTNGVFAMSKTISPVISKSVDTPTFKLYSSYSTLGSLHPGSSLLKYHEHSFGRSLYYPMFAATTPLQFSPIVCQTRTVTVVSRNKGKRKTSQMIISRFKRLGNGLWIHRIPGYKKKVWRMIMKSGGPRKLYNMRKHIICNNTQSTMLDKLVTDYWKRPRWIVTDPYKGYDEYAKFYYNPASVPGINEGRREEHNEYWWRRYNSLKQRRIVQKRKHLKVTRSPRQKPIPKTGYFH